MLIIWRFMGIAMVTPEHGQEEHPGEHVGHATSGVR